MNVQTVSIKGETDISEVCIRAKDLATRGQLCVTDVSRFVTAVSELAWNVVKYAQSGSCLLCSQEIDGQQTIVATFEDHGPGILDIEAAMRDGFTTGGGLGGGLPGAKRLVDTFDIMSEPGHTVITVGVMAGVGRRHKGLR